MHCAFYDGSYHRACWQSPLQLLLRQWRLQFLLKRQNLNSSVSAKEAFSKPFVLPVMTTEALLRCGGCLICRGDLKLHRIYRGVHLLRLLHHGGFQLRLSTPPHHPPGLSI